MVFNNTVFMFIYPLKRLGARGIGQEVKKPGGEGGWMDFCFSFQLLMLFICDNPNY
jgi:hypothetical protein